MERILLTGASGFLGSAIYNKLKSENFEVITLGRSNHNAITCDLSKTSPELTDKSFDYVIHAAGLAHKIPTNKKQVQEFYDINVLGTKNLLRALKKNLPKTIIFISSVAVYGLNKGELIDETYPLNGTTPYASSKISAENNLLAFGNENKVNILILRLPLITGASPKGNLGALLKAIKKGYYVRIGNGNAKKSMVSAIAVSKLIPKVLAKNGCYNLTDGIHPSMKEIETFIGNRYGKSIWQLPQGFVKLVAYIGNLIPFFPLNTSKFAKMTTSLTFSDLKAVQELGWKHENALNDLRE